MKKFIFTIILLSLFGSIQDLRSQFPLEISVQADGSIYESPETEFGVEYRITVSGTYSMWPREGSEECYGVDAAYVYDVPQSEIDGLRWPPEYIDLFGTKVPVVPLPQWVGDPQVYSFPPEPATPLYKLSFRRYTGFRIDHEPLQNSGFQPVTHRYQITKVGTGNPFQFQILDSNMSILEEKVIARYDDNCGGLKVTIEKIGGDDNGGSAGDPWDMNIGDIDVIKDENGSLTGRKIKVTIDETDSSKINNKYNIIKDLPDGYIGIIHNGKIICDIDSIICDERTEPISIGLVVDRSGSMLGPISDDDMTQRMQASKNALNNFVDILLDDDEVFLVSFSSDITIDQDNTNDKELIKSAINNITPDGSTAVWGAINVALEKISVATNPNRFLIVLSDGGNTANPSWEDSNVLTNAHNRNIPIYIVALGLTDQPIDVEGREKMELVTTASNGKIFDVYNSDELAEIYQQLSGELTTEEDCFIYLTTDSCKPGEEGWVRIIYTPNDSTVISEVIRYKCPETTETSVRNVYSPYGDEFNNIKIYPNPTKDIVTVNFNAKNSSTANFKVVDQTGKYLFEKKDIFVTEGDNSVEIDLFGLAQGQYQLIISNDYEIISTKVIIIK